MRHEAIMSVHPEVVTVNGDGWDKIQAWDSNGADVVINQAAVEEELKRRQDAYDNDHTRKRKEEYPSIDELVVALWEGVVEERMAAVTKLEIKRQAVKAKHPK